MSNICLLPDEKAILNKVRDSKIPSIFKTDYLDFLLTVENISYLAVEILAGKKFNYDLTEEYNAMLAAVDTNILDENAKEYYKNLIAAFNILKKYY